MIVSDWTQAAKSEEVLKSFVKILYGTGPSFASLDFKVLLEVISLATAHYEIPGCRFLCKIFLTLHPFVTSLVRQALKSAPGRVRNSHCET